MRVHLLPEEKQRNRRREYVDSPRARLGESPRTGSNGEVEFLVPPDSYELQVYGREVGAGDATRDIAALQDGETRELVVEVRTARDLRFHGRVIDDSSGAPIPGASVRLFDPKVSYRYSGGQERGTRIDSSREIAHLEADASGAFELWATSWRETLLRIEAPRYAWTYGTVQIGHEIPEDEMTIRLARPAVLLAKILDSGEAAKLVEVRLETDPRRLVQGLERFHEYELVEPRWSASTGIDGTVRIEGLPPGIPLDVVLEAASKRPAPEPLKVTLAPLTFAPSEVREQVWHLDHPEPATGTVSGVVVSAEKPRGIVRLAREDWNPDGRFEEVRIQRDGTFRFESQKPGRYTLIGLSQDGRTALQSGVTIEAGMEVSSRSLQLAPGAKLRVRRGHALSDIWIVRVIQQGSVVSADTLLGNEVTLIVPPGECQVLIQQLWGGILEERAVVALADQEILVELAGEDR